MGQQMQSDDTKRGKPKRKHTGFAIPGPGRKPGFKHSEETKDKLGSGKKTHGVYALIRGFKKGRNPLDGRTASGKAINEACRDLLAECGSEPSCKQRILVDLIRTKLAILDLGGKSLAGTEPENLEEKERLLATWARYANSLAKDLQLLGTLGNDRREVMDYAAYVEALKDGGGR